MLKILRTVPFFAPAYSHGGPVVHSYNLSKIQVLAGYDVRVFTTNIVSDGISRKLPRFEVLDGIKIHRFPIKAKFGHYFITPKILFSFFKHDFDIIHSHSFRTFQTDSSTIYSKFMKKPLVFTAHGTLRNMYLLNLFITKKKEANRMKLYDYFFKDYFINTVDRVIVHSKHEKFWTLKFNVPENKIRVIPHGVNIISFTNLRFKENFKKKYQIKEKMILYVGRLFRNYRNLDYLIESMKGVISEYKNVKLWIVGHSFDKDYELELKRKVDDLNLNKNVNFVLNPSREDIIGAFQNSNLFVFPITEADGFGIPLLEAGAAKCPVITTNRGPAPEIVKNGKTGLLLKKNTPNYLKEAILKVITDDDIESKMGKNGFEHIKKNFDWQIITEKTNEVYRELL